MHLPATRLLNHQLVRPLFASPQEVVAWMGAVQAQHYAAAKWAVAMRTPTATLGEVEAALRRGDILRTHVLRPTWHLVSADNLRRMLHLSGARIRKAVCSYAGGGDNETRWRACYALLERLLRDNRHLTRDELAEAFTRQGHSLPPRELAHLLLFAEADALICSGGDRDGRTTYALLDERVPPAAEESHEEALARVADRYFRSHTPATAADFTWWSGLSATDARRAIASLSDCLRPTTVKGTTYYVHTEARIAERATASVHLLPPFDEYLIAYKDRSAVVPPAHSARAHNEYGTFYPLLLHRGIATGNWELPSRRAAALSFTFFDASQPPPTAALHRAAQRYARFLGRPLAAGTSSAADET